MAGYHLLKTLHNAGVITNGEANIDTALPSFQTLIYRLRVTNVTGSNGTLQVRLSTLNSQGDAATIAQTININQAQAVSLMVNSTVANLRIGYVFTGAGINYTINDEVEAIG